MSEKNHRFLKISARVFNVLAWLAVAVYAAAGTVSFVNNVGPWEPRATSSLLLLCLGGLIFFLFGTLSGIIRLLLEIESKIK